MRTVAVLATTPILVKVKSPMFPESVNTVIDAACVDPARARTNTAARTPLKTLLMNPPFANQKAA
jgi:hypothetical protein